MGYENNRNKRKEIEGNAESEWKLRETEGESPLLGKGEWRGKCEMRRPQFLVKLTHLGKLATKQKYNVGPTSLGQRWATVSNSHRANVYSATVCQPNYNIGAALAQRLYASWVANKADVVVLTLQRGTVVSYCNIPICGQIRLQTR